jgi:predicted AAA+ superfamily ATPase
MLQVEKNDIQRIICDLLSITVYRGVLDKPVTSRLLDLLNECRNNQYLSAYRRFGDLCSALLTDTGMKSPKQAIAEEILADENVFTLTLAKSGAENLTEELLSLAKRDLSILYSAASNSAGLIKSFFDAGSPLPCWGDLPADYPLAGRWDECINALGEFHLKNGAGRFAFCNAFLWLNRDIIPIEHPDPVRLGNLKGYETQKSIVVNNTLAFLDGFEANNILLYGDRGTGKSSTVKALLNEYAGRKLRMIEVPKENLNELPVLTSRLASFPMRFIVFIDDLSFSANSDSFAALKAALEGSLACRPDNLLIYATSNRRHLLKESFSDRGGDEIYHADTIQESVSLSDRFGLVVTYLLPDKQRFLDIVLKIADDHDIDIGREKLLALAERWAVERGARSPRYAKQFIQNLRARLARGEKV